MILWAILLMLAVWLCAYAAVRRDAYWPFYAIAVLPVPVVLGWAMQWVLHPGGSVTPTLLIVLGVGVAAVAYPINHLRLRHDGS